MEKTIFAYASDGTIRKRTRAYQYTEELCRVFAEWRKKVGDAVQ